MIASQAAAVLAAAPHQTLQTITVGLCDAARFALPVGRSGDALECAEAAEELEYRARTGRWSIRADASPPSCVRAAVEIVNRLRDAAVASTIIAPCAEEDRRLARVNHDIVKHQHDGRFSYDEDGTPKVRR